ncbi:MAG: M24 family metallopeptidase [Candidatus Firestonebacteria bacterium]
MLNINLEKEILEKEERVRQFLKKHNLDGILITKQNNFAWWTRGGDNHVVTASQDGVASILVTHDKKYIITSNIEACRIMDEEVKGQDFILEKYNWWEDAKKLGIIKKIVNSGNIGTDDGFGGYKNIDNVFARLRYSLTEEEIKRYKWLGGMSGKAMVDVCKKIKRGDTEFEVAGALSQELLKEGITPVVLLVAADDRISKYRHPIPTNKKIKKVVMVVVCARKWGLIVSLTRIVHFGKIPSELRKKHNAVVKVDAAFNLNTIVGANVGEIFKKALSIYKQTGFEDEWRLHHQGGSTGYAGRDYKATSENNEVVLVNQGFAWNPSITGTKSEDTIIVRKDKIEVISETPNWPMIEVKIDGKKILRADILVKK